VSGWQPRQQRAVETRRRILDAAMAEMERAGLDQARVEDIVALAGVAWGSFYRYFANKEDVLLDAAATVAEVFASSCEVGVASGLPRGDVIVGAFWRAASAAPRSRPLWDATFRALGERPERLGHLLSARHVPQPVDVLAEVIDGAQRAGEMRDDFPAPLLANVVTTAAWANALREGPVGVTASEPPKPGAAAQTSRRSLAVVLLIAGLRAIQAPAAPAVPSSDLPGRIGRARSPANETTEGAAQPGRGEPPIDRPGRRRAAPRKPRP
jgi:AcrR family transcriptional regulator